MWGIGRRTLLPRDMATPPTSVLLRAAVSTVGRFLSTSLPRWDSTVKPGLFSIAGLHTPHDFLRMAHEARARCDAIVGDIAAAPPSAQTVQLMDDLSDELCRTYDAAECCRSVHSDAAWRSAAAQVCTQLGEYISQVNQDTMLYSRLAGAVQRFQRHQQQVMQNAAGQGDGHASASASAAFVTDADGRACPGGSTLPESATSIMPLRSISVAGAGSWATRVMQQLPGLPPLSPPEASAYDAETVLVGSKLLMDMEKAGIHLGESARTRMQELMNLNQHYGARFNAALNDATQLGSVTVGADPPSRAGAPRGLLGRVMHAGRGDASSRGSGRHIPLDAGNMSHVLVTEPDEATRKAVWLAGHRKPFANVALMDEIIAARREMAELVGCASFSEYKAVDASLAGEPQSIVGFLEQVARAIRGGADAEAASLSRLKADLIKAGDGAGGGRRGTRGVGAPQVHAWDVDYLMARARAQHVCLPPGALSEYFNLASVLEGVCELMSTTFGLACDVAPAPPDEAWAPGILKLTAVHADDGPLGTVYLDLCSRPGKYPGAVTFPIRCGRLLSAGRYQLPVMALLADFGPGSPNSVCLTYRELRTLLHELGHCCHNLASRTRYQHLWGTRCAQDMVEVPSHLWEHFALDAVSLGVLARHRGGDRSPLPPDAAAQLASARRMFSGLELQAQVLLALVDQHYFGRTTDLQRMAAEAGGAGRLPTTSAVWAHVSRAFSSIPHPDGTHPQARISHFTVYGASYYSYVYARFISAAVWNQYLQGRPLDPDAGAAVWRGLLAPGGTVEPVDLVRSLLGRGALQQVPSGGWALTLDESIIARVRDSF